MTSSPAPQLPLTDFETLLQHEGVSSFPESSPIHTSTQPAFNFDPLAPSPGWALGKTPGPHMKVGSRNHPLCDSPSILRASISTAALANGSPLSYRRTRDVDDVHVVDPSDAEAWTGGLEDEYQNPSFPTQGINFEAQFTGSPYASPSKPKYPQHVPSTPALGSRTAYGTPTHSPQASRVFSAPNTVQRRPATQRSVTGLGTPSRLTHQSGGQGRRTTYNTLNPFPVSPSPSRRRTETSTSLTTSGPLARNVSSSSSFLDASAFHEPSNRVVSGVSVMTASTSYDLQSPTMSAYNPVDFSMPASQSLPGLMPSQQASPQASHAPSPTCQTPQDGSYVWASPLNMQSAFDAQNQSQMSLMGGVNQIMGNMSVPNSTSMASVSSFPGHGGMRQQTLDTIIETPALAHEEVAMPGPSVQPYQPNMTVPSQPDMASDGQFQQMSYPAIPGAQHTMFAPHILPQQAQSVDIGAWSRHAFEQQQHTQQIAMSGPTSVYGFANFPAVERQYVIHPQQAVSYQPVDQQPHLGHGPAQNHGHSLAAPPMALRSVSAPVIPTTSTSMTSLPSMPMSLATGGLFGPGTTEHQLMPSQEEYHLGSSEVQLAETLSVSPDTPRKRKAHPRVGNPMRPGPRPKPKTPKKKKGSSIDTSSPEPRSSGLECSSLAGPSISHHQPGQTFGGRPPTPPSKTLTFGPDLATIAMKRSLSSQSMSFAPGPQPQQPQLVIQPPRGAGNPDQPISGLSKTFLETLYTTYMTREGSMTGQPVKRFRCSIEGCERSFPRKSAIHSHIQTHLEDKPFVCEVEDCGAAFVRQHDLRRHARIHSGTKPFPCDCGKGFARGDALQRHRQRGICSGSSVPRRPEREHVRYGPY